VARGVLFALYPDNKLMGENLARLALAEAGGKTVGFEANRSVQSAINRRTAEHLGITPNLAGYDLVLPAR
jgi:putative ABC transport system substrate-binding protein